MGYRAAALEAGTSWPAVAAAEEAGKEDGEGPGRGWRGKVRLSRVAAVVWVLGAAAFWAAQHCGFRRAAISKAE